MVDKQEENLIEEQEEQEEQADTGVTNEAGLEIEVEDDTPEEDRGREPMPKEIVQELESDELEEYTGKAKSKLKQMKKVWNDERRGREQAVREQMEAVSVTQRVMEENRRLKSTLSSGERQLLDTYKVAAGLELEAAKRQYKEAYESGDSDKVTDAQEKMSSASYRLEQVKAYVPTLQAAAPPVDFPQQAAQQPQQATQQPPTTDAKTKAWQEHNSWWGSDEEMTGTAFGLHQRLLRDKGVQFVGTDEYWQAIDTTMQRRFPEYFEGEEPQSTNANGKSKPTSSRTRTRPANVVAPASRSTTSRKVRLTTTQISLASKLGVTPEQYARELIKVESANG